jgi:hypothetical protein
MKNTSLISLSLLVLLGVSACSSTSQKPNTATKQGTDSLGSKTSVSIRPKPVAKATATNQWQAKQRLAAQQNEQVRLAYNHAWQQQQIQAKARAQAQARNLRNQQVNLQQNRQAQARAKAQQQNRLAQQYAAQQMQRQAQQRTTQNKNAQYLAMLQQRNNAAPRPQAQRNIASLTSSEIRTIGDKIFRNESGGDIDKLVHWNVGENFASMGIGHFTWYPSGRRNRYGNTFPGLLDHLQANGVQLPVWVQKARHSGAPWRTKNELKHAKNSRKVREFQNLLYQTRYLQASYIFERAKRAMPRLVKATPQHLRAHVAQNLNAVANTRGGWYALIDYVNFKGEGLNRRGGYKGQNWGLLQVLENMRPSQPGQMALNNFADSAIQILTRRVRNSNPSRGESRWMRGWTIRCNTYRQPFVI